MIKSLVIITIFLTLIAPKETATVGGHAWNYDVFGPDTWPHEFENCKGKRQSPIDIKSDNLEFDKNLKPFKFINYDKPVSWNVSHNGHTVVVNRLDELNLEVGVEGSDFDNKFNLLQFHFHWGYNLYQGSEHLIDGQKFPLEVHFVHRSNEGTFTVLGFLFHLVENDNEGLAPLIQAIEVTRSKENHKSASFSLKSIIPEPELLDKYYRYSGSLTTPPCTEGVVWNVFHKHINISRNQLTSFHNNVLKLNFRDPQKIYSRKVFSSFPVESAHNHDNEHKTECSSSAKRIFKTFNVIEILTVVFLTKVRFY